MGKRPKFTLRRNDTLKSIEDDLDLALERLEGANRKVHKLLESFSPAPSQGSDQGVQETQSDSRRETSVDDGVPQSEGKA